MSGDGGPATGACLYDPRGVAVDAAGNLYIADTGNGRIRVVSSSGIITTMAGGGSAQPGDGGPATSAALGHIEGLALDAAGNLYLADYEGNRIRKVSPSGIITTVAGNGNAGYSGDGGPATSAQLFAVYAVAVDTAGGIYIADYGNNRIRKVSTSGVITTVAGNGNPGYSGDGGPATTSQLNGPTGVAVDASGNLYIADSENNRVRKVSQSGIITTAAGSATSGYSGDGGLATSAGLSEPNGVALDTAGNLYIGDTEDGRVRVVSPSGIITTVAGSTWYGGYTGDRGPATAAQLSSPWGIAIDTTGRVYVADSGNNAIRLLQPAVASQPTLSISKTHSGTFAQGQTGATYTVAVGNAASSGPTTGAVAITDTLPTGLTVVSMTGSGWSCASSTCTRSDVVNAGASYPAITVTVNVASNAPSQVTNQVTVSGGGSVSATANDVTNVATVASKIATTTTVAASPSAIATTASTTLTATVTAASGSGTPTGTVTFDLGSTVLGSATLSGTAQATLIVSGSQLAVGSNSVTANYSGDATYNGSSASVTVTATSSQTGTTFLQLTSATSRDWFPVWRPDGTKILFSSNRNDLTRANDIWEMNPDGSQQSELVQVDITTPSAWGDPGLAANTKEFIGSTGNIAVIKEQDYWEVMEVALASATSFPIVRTVWNGPDAFFSDLLFVPGGLGTCGFVYSNATQNAAWIDCDSGQQQVRIAPFSQLTGQSSEAIGTVLLTTSSDGAQGGLAFAPSGQQLVASLCLTSCSALNLGTDLYVLDATTGQIVQRLTSDGETGVSAIQPRWSPGGQSIAFVSDKSGNNEIWTVHPDGTGAQQVTANGLDNSGPSWSPDGKSLAFATNNDGSYSIWLASLAETTAPSINSGGVLNAASYAPEAVAPGSIAAVFGSFPVASPAMTPGTPWPISLGGLSVQFGAMQAPLYYASGSQANLQVPWELSGQTQTTISATANGQRGAAQTVSLATYSPGIFSMNGQGTGQGAIVDAISGQLLNSTNPAIAGSTYVSIYCTGLGPVTNQPATGAASPSNPLASTPINPTVMIGGVQAQVLFSGLAPGFVGEYQVNALVPAGVSPGNSVPVVIYIGGVYSNTVTIAVAASTSGGVSVQISPASATVLIGQMQQFSAVVGGSQNTAVTWAVNGITGGNTTVGTISSSGLYNTPGLVPNPPTVTVAGISQADTTKSGSAMVSLAYPLPQLTSISPSSVPQGSADTTITVTGLGFTKVSVVSFSGQALATAFVSSTQLTAIIPTLSLSSSGTATVSVTTPAPGGGTSSATQFTVTQAVAAATLVILGTPVYSGSPSGPWLLSVAATDSNGNPSSNVPIALTSSEGTISQNAAATNSIGVLTASITPPLTYSGEVVEISAVSGNQTAIVDIVFAASSTTVGQQAAAALARIGRRRLVSNDMLPADSSTSSTSSSGISQLVVGTSNGSAATNFFSGMLSPCTSNQELDTTQSVDCQSEFSTNQVQLTPYAPSSNACSLVGTITGIASCAGATGVLVACASPESGIGPVICAGGIGIEDDLAGDCAGYIAGEIAQFLASNNALKGAAGETIVNIAGLVQDTTSADPSALVGVTCSAIDAANAANVIQVTSSSPSAQLGQIVSLKASTSVKWSIINGPSDNSLGIITPTGNTTQNGNTTATYVAPSVAPTQNYCTFFSEYYADSCPVTIVAKGANPQDQTLTTILLSIDGTDAPPSISSLSSNPIAAGSPAQQVSINGDGFLAGDTVTFSGKPRTSSFISTNQLKVSLQASDLASVGSFPVVVTHSFLALPNSGGSASANLTVSTAPTPVPSAPSLISPGTPSDTGAVVPSTTPTLEWTGTGATQYDLAISQYPYGTSNVRFDSGRLPGRSETRIERNRDRRAHSSGPVPFLPESADQTATGRCHG